ncbi:MAG: class I SAM-dependent rRNA methyltransferase [Saprospiraceae bacterium]|nr:class I SAM-dependent rRNA methyltransferase [Saprospiraceae bacterium]MDP4997482.1 class I SAM-dependent rRNA methyltransferase [Saprospiraceae bacterium]
MKKVFIKSGKTDALKRFHPWIFSGALSKEDPGITDGELVEVCAANGDFLAFGHYQDGSIKIRVLSFEPLTGDYGGFWLQRLQDAFQLRQTLGFGLDAATNAYRLVHAEGDQLPGLIIDIYDRTAVVQCHSIGMHRDLPWIREALLQVPGLTLEAIYDKSRETLPAGFAETVENRYIWQSSQGTSAIRENGHTFVVDWEKGQKTGFFLDQRDNRQLLARYAPGKTVLNAFSYSGGFSVYALAAGAQQVHSVDVSKQAIELTEQNVALLKDTDPGRHQAFAQDVFAFLKQSEPVYDIMVVDPPAFAKNLKKRHNAVQGYKRLNAAALEKIKPGGLLFTFSCSQVIDRQLFQDTLVAAALEAGRPVRILHQLNQGADHPVNIFHPEGAYLKGLVLYVG